MSDSEDLVFVDSNTISPGDGHAEDMNGSVEVLKNTLDEIEDDDDAKYEREDIKQASEVVDRVKSAIQFQDDEALQQALDKVKERPLIDAAFNEKIQMLQMLKNNPHFENFHNTIDGALAQLKYVQEKAKEGKTSLSRPCEILNEVLPIFEKSCNIYVEKIELSDTVNKNLSKCDKIRGQVKECLAIERQDVNEAKRLEKMCDKLLEDAVKASKDDIQIVLDKQKEEKEADILAWFESTREENIVKMDYLTADFQQMRDNCAEDIELTETALEFQIERKEKAFENFKEKDTELAEEINEDLAKEKELEEQLRILREHRKNVELERERRQMKQDTAVLVHKKAEDDLKLLLDKFSNLLSKAGTANIVLKQTKDVCNKLFDKAVESKKTTNNDLDSLLNQRKKMSHFAMMAQAIDCKNNSESHRQAAKFVEAKLSKQSTKLRECLRLKLAGDTKERQDKIKKLSSEYEAQKKVLRKCDEKLEHLLGECKQLENEFSEANIEYETFDETFNRFKQEEEEGAEGYSLPSMPSLQ